MPAASSPAYTNTPAADFCNLGRWTGQPICPMNIRVNCYAPGNTDTPMVSRYYDTAPPGEQEMIKQQLLGTHLFGRLGTPAEVASLVVFLASDESSMMTGSCVTIDLGTTAWRGMRT